MKIKKDACIGCEACHPFCPMNAIATVEWQGTQVSEVDQDKCVECGVCQRAEVCPTDAIFMPELEWPRSIRALFSDPLTTHPSTKEQGRGTEEMKTNDVTGRFRRGIAGLTVEMGRPGIGTTFRDVQTMTVALARAGIELEPGNPVRSIVNNSNGKVDERIINEKILSVIIEFSVEKDRLRKVLQVLQQVSTQIDTVFSLGLISRVEPDGSIPVLSIAKEAGFSPRPNTKTNVGLGRPLKEAY